MSGVDDSAVASSETTTETSASELSSLADLAGFNTDVDATLAWLAEAREKFDCMKPIAGEVEAVKDQFHEHEV